jgi:hypothetical protein
VRTTLTIDEPLSILVEEEMKRTGESFKITINRLIEKGLSASKENVEEPYVVKPFPIALQAGMNYDNISELLDQLDGPGWR